MEEKVNWFAVILDKAIEFAKTAIELLKLRAIDKISGTIAAIAARIAAVVLFFTGLMIGSIGVAIWLGDLLGKSWFGFFIVAGLYFLFGFIMFFLLRNMIKKRVNALLIKKILE